MKSRARITSVHAALRRQRLANARTIVRYEGGPAWCDGRIIPDDQITPSDQVIEIVYKAPAGAQNVVRLTWGDDDQASTQD